MLIIFRFQQGCIHTTPPFETQQSQLKCGTLSEYLKWVEG